MKKTIARLTAAVAACTAVLAASLPVSAASDITVSSNFAGASGDVANGSMLTTFPELEAVNKNARIKNSFGKRCIGMGAGENSAAELVYKLTVPEGEQLTELTITVNALLAARPDKNPDWTGDNMWVLSTCGLSGEYSPKRSGCACTAAFLYVRTIPPYPCFSRVCSGGRIHPAEQTSAAVFWYAATEAPQ